MTVNITSIKTASNGVWQGDSPLDFAFPLLILQTILILVVSRFLALLLKPLRQPKVIAEIVVRLFSNRFCCVVFTVAWFWFWFDSIDWRFLICRAGFCWVHRLLAETNPICTGFSLNGALRFWNLSPVSVYCSSCSWLGWNSICPRSAAAGGGLSV